MTAYEIAVRIYLNKNIKVTDIQGAIVLFIDSFLIIKN